MWTTPSNFQIDPVERERDSIEMTACDSQLFQLRFGMLICIGSGMYALSASAAEPVCSVGRATSLKSVHEFDPSFSGAWHQALSFLQVAQCVGPCIRHIRPKAAFRVSVVWDGLSRVVGTLAGPRNVLH